MNLEDIKAFALNKHANQRYGAYSYGHHLQAVVDRVMQSSRCSEDLIAAAWLHDTLEDTDATPEEIEAISNGRVLALVQLLTDKPGKNRRERHEATYPLIAQDPDAIVIKIADRLANVCAGMVVEDHSKLKMYRKEMPYFRAVFFNPDDPEIVKAFANLDKWLEI